MSKLAIEILLVHLSVWQVVSLVQFITIVMIGLVILRWSLSDPSLNCNKYFSYMYSQNVLFRSLLFINFLFFKTFIYFTSLREHDEAYIISLQW